MILLIDTSSVVSVVALLEPGGGVRREERVPSRGPALRDLLRSTAAAAEITRVAVATGPGSFTGLRVGVSFGLGLAIGLRIPIVALPTLAIQAARGRSPVTAVSEAGRGRFYFQLPHHDARLGAPREIPNSVPLAGLLSPESIVALEEAGHVVVPDAELRGLGEAAASLLKSMPEVPYDRLKLDYVQAFSARNPA